MIFVENNASFHSLPLTTISRFFMVIQTTLSSVRPGGGKGKGAPRSASSGAVSGGAYYQKPPAYQRAVSPSRTDELCPDDWLSTADREAELAELDEIIRLMDEQNNEHS